jgi:hypothetical protein
MTDTPEPRKAPEPRTVEDRVSRMAGEVESAPDPMVALSTRIPESLRKRLRIAALTHDIEVQDAVAEALELWLSRRERRG